jgi:Fe-S cluster biogenesis protein NfuA
LSLTGRIAKRIRRGVERRADRVLDRLGLKPARAQSPAPVSPFADPTPAPAVEVAPAVAAPAPAPAADDTAGLPLLTWEQVQALFEESVRPALQSDGGDITLVRVEDNDVFVELTGACHTCPSSIVTMQNGIERLLAEEFPQFGRLVRVDGPGADPSPPGGLRPSST